MTAKDYLSFSVSKEIKYLYKSFLESLEDIHRQHDTSLFKLMNALPKEYHSQVIQASFFDDESYQHFRKIALDHGNEKIRAILEEINRYEVSFRRGEEAKDF